MTDMDEPRDSCRTDLLSSTAMPGQEAALPHAAVAWEDTDPAMERLDVAQMSRLEQANIDLVLESLRIDPAHLDLRPLIRFWSHVCISHGELISEVVGHGISDRTIVRALQEAQDEAELSPAMDEIAAACPDVAARLRAALVDPRMTRMWSPSDLEWRACGFRMGDLASAVEMWDGEDLHALSGVLQEMVELCCVTGDTVADHIDLDDLPPAALLAAGIDASVPGVVSGSGVERQAV